MRIGDAEHHDLHRGKPRRQRSGILLDQDTDKALEAANDGSVQHDRAMARAIFADKFSIQALRQVRVDLDRAALPLATKCIFKHILDLGTVERPLTRQVLKFATRRTQALGQCRFGAIPAFFRADALVRTRRQLVKNLGKAEILVDLLQQRRKRRHLGLDHVFRTKDVAVVLREAAHAHDAVQAT